MALTTLLEKVKANLCRILHSVLCLHNAWVLICLYITAAIFYDLYDRLFSVCGHVFFASLFKKSGLVFEAAIHRLLLLKLAWE